MSDNQNNKISKKMDPKVLSVMLGSAFLMATSSIGPGFLNNSTSLTNQYGALFVSICIIAALINVFVQFTYWPVIAVSGKRIPEIGNMLLFGWGYVILAVVLIASLGYNTGNIAGAGMGLYVAFGLNEKIGALLTCACGLIVFWRKELGLALDRFAQILGGIMLVGIFVMLVTNFPSPARAFDDIGISLPNYSLAALSIPIMAVLSTQSGGYVPLSGPQRLVDAGITGYDNLSKIRKSALMGIGVSEFTRLCLVLSVLGVIYAGGVIDAEFPAASAFRAGLGQFGYVLFGIILFIASLTSVIGCAYTFSALSRSIHPLVEKYDRFVASGVVIVSTIIMITVGQPAKLLLFVHVVAGFCIPFTLGTLLVAAHNKKIVGDQYRHPLVCTIVGVIIVLLVGYSSVQSVPNLFALFD